MNQSNVTRNVQQSNSIASGNGHRQHDDFLALQPIIERYAKFAFRALPEADREEAIAAAIAAAFVSFVRLKERGKDPIRDFPTILVKRACQFVRSGRHVGGHSSTQDVLSPLAQARHSFTVERLPISTQRSHESIYSSPFGQQEMDSYEERLHDNSVTPPPDQAAFRVDFPAFLKTLTRRDRALARFLSLGHSGKKASSTFGISQGRVTQLRQAWHEVWRIRHGDDWPRLHRRNPRRCRQRARVGAA